MIPTNGRYEAVFKDTVNGTTLYHRKPVEAWDDEGQALVVDEKSGQLRPASSFGNFHAIGDGSPPVVAVIPGSGWRVRWQNAGKSLEEPLLAWAIDADGWAKAIDASADGTAMPLEDCSDWVLVPPDES